MEPDLENTVIARIVFQLHLHVDTPVIQIYRPPL